MKSNADIANSLGLEGAISRRAALKSIGAAGVATTVGIAGASLTRAQDSMAPAALIEPNAGSWKTWLLSSGDQFRPAAPPNQSATSAELAELHKLAETRTAEDLDCISYCDAGSPGYRWNEVAMQKTLKAGWGPGDAYRTMALLNAAIYDATIAAWDAKYAFNRARPAVVDPTLVTAIPTPASPSYPCEHSATAGAASALLSFIFPDDAEEFATQANDAANSRVCAGVAFRSDVDAGLALGQNVAKLFVNWAKADGSDAEFDPASMPTGPGLWTGEPVYPTFGNWKTWVIEDAAAYRPAPPPEWDSPEREAEVEEVKNYQRDAHPYTELFFWPQDPAGRPVPDSDPFTSSQVVFYYAPVLHYLWGPELSQKISEYRLDTNPPRAARAYALVSIAAYDASVASWNAKFHYMTARPNQFDPEITTILPTYPIPDYPSGHATTLGGTAQVLAYLFPREAHFFQSRADENAASRMWAGIHFQSACDAGVKQGREVGQAVIDFARNDGADRQLLTMRGTTARID